MGNIYKETRIRNPCNRLDIKACWHVCWKLGMKLQKAFYWAVKGQPIQRTKESIKAWLRRRHHAS